jgi:HEAT repeat protein
VPTLIEALKDENGDVRQEATLALTKIDPEAVKKTRRPR